MKCKICGRKTNWNESYGKENFIVCPICHDKIAKVISNITDNHPYAKLAACEVIIEIGYLKEKGEKKCTE